MYSMFYVIDDRMDIKNGFTFQQAVDFIRYIAANYTEYEIMLRNANGEMIYKCVEIERKFKK